MTFISGSIYALTAAISAAGRLIPVLSAALMRSSRSWLAAPALSTMSVVIVTATMPLMLKTQSARSVGRRPERAA